jgi:hypothetical protein
MTAIPRSSRALPGEEFKRAAAVVHKKLRFDATRKTSMKTVRYDIKRKWRRLRSKNVALHDCNKSCCRKLLCRWMGLKETPHEKAIIWRQPH